MSKKPISLNFTEEMKGYVMPGDFDDYQMAYAQAKENKYSCKFRLTIKIADIDFFIRDPKEEAEAVGSLSEARLGKKRKIEKGIFNLFLNKKAKQGSGKTMRYQLFFTGKDGKPYSLLGFKDITDQKGFDVLRDTTTLYTKIYPGHVTANQAAKGNAVATGILHIQFKDFIKQLTTFSSNGGTFIARAEAIKQFAHLFIGSLYEVYGPHIFKAEKEIWQRPEVSLYTLEGVHKAEKTLHPFTTKDGLGLSLFRFKRKACDDVVLLSHGLTTSTDMFIMPEQKNLVNHLHDNGFTDVFSLDWRGSKRHSYNLFPSRFNLDDVALFDYPAAFAKLHELIGKKKRIHVICHCVGSITFFMSYFAKQIPGVSSIVSNSVSLTPNIPIWSKIKIFLFPFLNDYILRFPNINPNWSNLPGPGIARGKVFAKAASLFHHECDVPACHMISLMWGTGWPACYLHENLHEVTHRRVGDLFGAVSMNYFRHIRKMVRRKVVVKMNQRDAYYASLPDNYLEFAKETNEKTPILFMTGDTNRVFKDSNIISYKVLAKMNPKHRNELYVARGYGHQDTLMGKNNHQDTFQEIVQFLKKQKR